jgi:hypothetical protein
LKKRRLSFRSDYTKKFIYYHYIVNTKVDIGSKLSPVRPVSSDWIEQRDELSDVTWNLMYEIRKKPAYGADFLTNAGGSKRPVNRRDLDVNAVRTIGSVYQTVLGHFGLRSDADFVDALSATVRLTDGYKMGKEDIDEYKRVLNILKEKLPDQPGNDPKAKNFMAYAHAMVKLSLFRHGDLVNGVIVPHLFNKADKLTRMSRERDLYSDKPDAVGAKPKLRLVQDLSTLATVAFDGDEKILQRIAYHDRRFVPETNEMAQPNAMAPIAPMSAYIDRAVAFESNNMPKAYAPQNVMPKPKAAGK